MSQNQWSQRKHQYDYDCETVIGFLRQYDLLNDFKINIEVNHATLAGHTFQHEIQVAADAGVLGSLDANRGDYQNGWDTDQFPNNLNEITEAMLVFLEAGAYRVVVLTSMLRSGEILLTMLICFMHTLAVWTFLQEH